MAGRIFINYRRGDDAGFTQALYQRLEDEFSAENIFMDVEGHIRPGDDFVQVLNTQVAAADVLLAIIGPRWAELLAARAGDPDDFVTVEIKAALDKDKRVIPVLVGGATIPRADLLPEGIRALARRNAVGLRPERFRSDCQGLVTALREQLASAEAERAARTEAERLAAEAVRHETETAAAARAAEAEQRARAQALAGLTPEEVRKAEELANWKFLEDRRNVAELRDHLARFPGGTTERYALTKLEGLVWSSVNTADPNALHAYLAEFPNGANADSARKRLARLAGRLSKSEHRSAKPASPRSMPQGLVLLCALAATLGAGLYLQEMVRSLLVEPAWSISNTVWMASVTLLAAAALVPGLALLSAHPRGSQWSTLAPVTLTFALAALIWIVLGYSLVWTNGGSTNALVGGFSKIFLIGVDASTQAPTFTKGVLIPEYAFAAFMMVVACAATASVGGLLASRISLAGIMLAMGLWTLLVHVPLVHMMWYWAGPDAVMDAANAVAAASGDAAKLSVAEATLAYVQADAGIAFQWGALDYAGGAVVHMAAGATGLFGALMLSKPTDPDEIDATSDAASATLIGGLLFCLGWLGLIAGSNLEAGHVATVSIINALSAATASAFTWMLAEWLAKGSASSSGLAWGAMTGVVALSPAAGFALPLGSVVLGIVASVVCFMATHLRARPVEHEKIILCILFLGGLVGMLGTGVVAAPQLGGFGVFDYTTSKVGDFDIFAQLTTQTKGAGLALIWSVGWSLAIFAIARAIFGSMPSAAK